MTEFQDKQVRSIHAEHARDIAKLKATGAIAQIGIVYYPGMHSNICTMISTVKYGSSKCFKGDDPKGAVAAYARSVFGSGKLKLKSVDKNSDGTVGKTYLVFIDNKQTGT